MKSALGSVPRESDAAHSRVLNRFGEHVMRVDAGLRLPAQLSRGNWTCTRTGGAVCASGTGNTLSDTVTLPVGSQALYVYSATVTASGANDQIVNTASAALSSGMGPAPANNSASDTNVAALFKNRFDGAVTLRPSVIGDGQDFIGATMRIDAARLGALSMVPVAVASGKAADGKVLFTLELA